MERGELTSSALSSRSTVFAPNMVSLCFVGGLLIAADVGVLIATVSREKEAERGEFVLKRPFIFEVACRQESVHAQKKRTGGGVSWVTPSNITVSVVYVSSACTFNSDLSLVSVD